MGGRGGKGKDRREVGKRGEKEKEREGKEQEERQGMSKKRHI